jgi:hypothetical protein
MTVGQILLRYTLHKLKIEISSNSRAITLEILKKSTTKTPGTQLYILNKIPLKFHNSKSKDF